MRRRAKGLTENGAEGSSVSERGVSERLVVPVLVRLRAVNSHQVLVLPPSNGSSACSKRKMIGDLP